MNSPNTIEVLNRLVVIHHRSLGMYLGYAPPTWHRDDQQAKEELGRIVADQKDLIDRIGEMVVGNHGAVFYGSYPMEFTGYHDLSFEFLLEKLLDHQRDDIAAIETCVSLLEGSPAPARSIAQEALGMAKGHLESFEELKRSAVSD